MVRVTLVEDHAATREALCQHLARHAARVRVVASHPDAESLLASSLDAVGVARVDLRLPRMSGPDLIRALSVRAPGLPCVALTSIEEPDTVFETIEAGAYGYLLKDEPPDRIVACLLDAAAGASPVSSRVAGLLFSHARRAAPHVRLSKRERELAGRLVDGLTYAECAADMGLALGTVQNYVKRLYRKLDVNTRREVCEWMARYARP